MPPDAEGRDWRKRLLALYQAVEAGRCDAQTFRDGRAAAIAEGWHEAQADPCRHGDHRLPIDDLR